MGIFDCFSNNCNEKKTCGCTNLLSALCVIYEGVNLPSLNITHGDKLEVILKNINDAILYLNNQFAGLGDYQSLSHAITDIQNKIAGYNGVYVEEFTNSTANSVTLTNASGIEVLNVYFNGIALSHTEYGFNVPNTVVMDFSVMGYNRALDDIIRVEYKKS